MTFEEFLESNYGLEHDRFSLDDLEEAWEAGQRELVEEILKMLNSDRYRYDVGSRELTKFLLMWGNK